MKKTINFALVFGCSVLSMAAGPMNRTAVVANAQAPVGSVPMAPGLETEPEYHMVDRDLRIMNQADPDRLTEDCEESAVVVEHARPAPGRFQPMIQSKDSGLVPSNHFIAMAPILTTMNRLAYDRGRDQVHGPEIMYSQSLKGWDVRNVTGVRGRVSVDRAAAFVAYHKDLNTMVVCFRGSISNSDWVTNLSSVSQRFDAIPTQQETLEGSGSGDEQSWELVDAPLAGIGRGHAGFIHKVESCRKQISVHVSGFLAALSPEQRATTKFYVTGHSQGAALGMLEMNWLCEDLKRWYGPEFSNARSNKVHAWLLATPRCLDRTAVAYTNAFVGKRNILVQNTSLDPVGLASVNNLGQSFLHAGTLATQSSLEALAKSAKIKLEAVTDSLMNGHYSTVGGLAQAAYAMVTGGASLVGSLPVAIIAPLHMGSDAVTPGQQLLDHGFDPAMVSRTMGDIKWALDNAFNLEQAALQRASGTMSTSQKVWSWLGY